MVTIKIDSISQDKVAFGTKVTFVDGKNKYSFFDSKKGGGLTKAMEQFKKYGFKVGDTVNAEVKEEEKSFQKKDFSGSPIGDPINYTQRTILYFQEVENTPVFSSTPIRDETDLEFRIRKLEAAVFGNENQPF